MKRMIQIALLPLAALIFEGCRHAWVRYPQTSPPVCGQYPDSINCSREKAKQVENKDRKGETHVLHQAYYFFGYYPRRLVLNAAEYCPAGPKSIHQYSSFRDGLLEQLTLTVYSPQTVVIECYAQ